jgi:hypothetical protein
MASLNDCSKPNDHLAFSQSHTRPLTWEIST